MSTPEQILHSINSTRHNTAIVESSTHVAERKGDNKAGSNAEKKIGAYLHRLDTLLESDEKRERISKHIADELVVSQEDIPESYWKQQEQLARDNGKTIELTEDRKMWLTKLLQDAQRTGMETWFTYLDGQGLEYPTWFKVYAIEGMASLGGFDKKKGVYAKRSRGTVAPYPQLNAAALAKTYDAVLSVHGHKNRLSNETNQQIVQGGNFNKIYSHLLLETQAIIPTPESPDEVHGEWREYTQKDVQAINHAAEGTPWCIAGENAVKGYLGYRFDQDNHKYLDTYYDDGSKFYLYHLQDPETGVFSPTACASIRMEGDVVEEISGLEGGSNQIVEDALVPTVIEKVKTLRGGELFIEEFENRAKLIAMDKKFQSGEDFNIDELRFIYELDGPIHTEDNDSRLIDFRSSTLVDKHIEQLSEGGCLYDLVNTMAGHNMPGQTGDRVIVRGGRYRDGTRPEPIHLAIGWIDYNFDALIKAGCDFSKMDPGRELLVLSDLRKHGVAIDFNALAHETAFYRDPYDEPMPGWERELLATTEADTPLADTPLQEGPITAEESRQYTRLGSQECKKLLDGGMNHAELIDIIVSRSTPGHSPLRELEDAGFTDSEVGQILNRQGVSNETIQWMRGRDKH